MIKSIYYTFIFLVFIIPANAQLNSPVKFQTQGRIVNHTLILNADNSFEYMATGDMAGAKAKGTWKKKRRRIILNSYDEFRTGYSILKESTENCNSDTSYFHLFVLNKYGYPLAYSEAVYQDKIYTIPENGMLSLKKGSDSIIKISFLGETHEIKVVDQDKRCKNIVFFQKERWKIYFSNEIWKCRFNKIIIPSKIILKRSL
jgi:hypothetical protein